MLGKYVIVRCRDAGVHHGYLKSFVGRCVELERECRRLHGWESGHNTLHEFALRGGANTQVRISEPVAYIVLPEVCEIIPCTAEAEADLRRSRWEF